MQTCEWKDYSLSRLMLGTVQWGMPYGIANRRGQPSGGEVLAMVAVALERGVNCFDTAAAYGSSEELLGRALRELSIADRVVVVTKVRPLTTEELADATLARRAIEQSVAQSRRRLGLDCLPVVLFHREADASYLPVLEELKGRGWLRYAGVSCDNRPGPAARFAAMPEVAALQLPANILDRRHRQRGSLAAAAAHGTAVFVRSVYLQGLLLMPEEAIPAALQAVAPVRRRLAELADQAGISMGELAVRYVLGHEGVTCVLTGVETVAQVRQNVALFARGPLSTELEAVVEAVAPELPETILTPALWNSGVGPG